MNKELIVKQIVNKYKIGWSARKIGRWLNKSHNTIVRILRKAGVEVLNRKKVLDEEFNTVLQVADEMGVDLYEMSLRARWHWAKQHGLFSGCLEKFRQLWNEYENSETF
jgi:hypothetical protein